MIKLEQVHIDRIINETPNGIILAILKENNATSLTDLIKIRYENPQLDWKEIDDRIKEISEEIYNHNHDTHNKKFIYTNPKVYTFEPYDDARMTLSDNIVKGYELITNPTVFSDNTNIKLSWYTIKEIKEYLSHTDENGKNYLECVIRNKKSSIEFKLPQIIKTLNIYQEQLEDQSKLTDKNTNLFYYQKKEKENIITEEYKEIINYLLDNYTTFTWGTLTDAQKRKLASSAINNRKNDRTIKERTISLLTNYTLLPELSNLSKEPEKVLRKIIKK